MIVSPDPIGQPTTTRTDRRTELVRAATALFSERAYDEVTTTEIAKRAGVAYGLIAHHFTNKRGLYLATIAAAAERLRAVHDAPVAGETPAAMLRDAITRHIVYIEDNSGGFLALMHGARGSDAEVRSVVEDLRWQSVGRLLRAFGAGSPLRPVLRATMQGWVGFLDETVIDYLQHHDLSRDELVDMVVAALVAGLRTAHTIDPAMGIDPRLIEQLGG